MNQFTVDIDTDYDVFMAEDTGFKTLRDRINNRIAGVERKYIRRSSNNHVHVKVILSYEITLLEALAMRAFLDDDPQRIACDLCRYYEVKDVDNTGRCFDEKYSKGKIRYAGVWVKF